MILGIRSSLIKEVDRLPGQLHKLPLEPHISHLRNVLLAITPVILKEQSNRGSRVPMRAIERDLENVFAGYWLRNLDGLCRVELRGCGEI